MHKFVKNGVIFRAIRIEMTEEFLSYINKFRTNDEVITLKILQESIFVVKTPGGPIQASIGDWLIEGADGTFELCKDDIFRDPLRRYYKAMKSYENDNSMLTADEAFRIANRHSIRGIR